MTLSVTRLRSVEWLDHSQQWIESVQKVNVGLLPWNFLERKSKSMKDLKIASVLVEFRTGNFSDTS